MWKRVKVVAQFLLVAAGLIRGWIYSSNFTDFVAAFPKARYAFAIGGAVLGVVVYAVFEGVGDCLIGKDRSVINSEKETSRPFCPRRDS